MSRHYYLAVAAAAPESHRPWFGPPLAPGSRLWLRCLGGGNSQREKKVAWENSMLPKVDTFMFNIESSLQFNRALFSH